MSKQCVINVDLVDVWKSAGRKELLRTLAWGDAVTVLNETASHIEIEFTDFFEQPDKSIGSKRSTGFIAPSKSSKIKPSSTIRPVADNTVLKVHFIDVQQGDGAMIESPDGKVILIDGGDNQMFARYLAARYRAHSPESARQIDCILVTHGDADHFEGLIEIFKSEKNDKPLKRLFIQPKRIFHNGLVKRPSKKNNKAVPDEQLLGPTKKVGKDLMLVDLVDSLLDVPDEEMNQPFREWKAALKTYNQRSPIEFRRLEFGDQDAFKFFNSDELRIEVLGPLVKKVAGKSALKFLGDPPRGARLGHESVSLKEADFPGHSASHTINGHSIVFRLVYGDFSFLFSGDLNDEASRFLASAHKKGELDLRADVFKVPHHGSADFSGAFFQAAAPVISVVSSGDESARKEFMHPRATVMGTLGRYSRVAEPLIFVTEMVAFFQMEGKARLSNPKENKKRGEFFSFSRTNFGIVKVRTDGKRLFIYTDSGNVKMKEAYAYELDAAKLPIPSPVKRA